MTQTFGMNANSDLYLGPNDNIVILSGIEAVKSACLTATRAQLGEMVLETGQGIPNFQLVWVGSPDYALWQSYLQNTLQNVDGVLQVNSIRLSAQNNKLSYIAEIRTVFGTTTING